MIATALDNGKVMVSLPVLKFLQAMWKIKVKKEI
jgi:hypothetical protein